MITSVREKKMASMTSQSDGINAACWKHLMKLAFFFEESHQSPL